MLKNEATKSGAEPEITPEMIEAGVRVLWDSGMLAIEAGNLDRLLVEEVVTAALAIRPEHQAQLQTPRSQSTIVPTSLSYRASHQQK